MILAGGTKLRIRKKNTRSPQANKLNYFFFYFFKLAARRRRIFFFLFFIFIKNLFASRRLLNYKGPDFSRPLCRCIKKLFLSIPGILLQRLIQLNIRIRNRKQIIIIRKIRLPCRNRLLLKNMLPDKIKPTVILKT